MSEDPIAPRRISNRVLDVNLTGYLSLFLQGTNMTGAQPVWLEQPGSPHLYLAVFSSKERIDIFLVDYPISYDKIIHIDDGLEFISSIPREYKIIIDPYKHTNGRMRYSEVFR